MACWAIAAVWFLYAELKLSSLNAKRLDAWNALSRSGEMDRYCTENLTKSAGWSLSGPELFLNWVSSPESRTSKLAFMPSRK